mmetsp:Transcript_49840/g.128230  ORF Transcript_49840/g.128230 Transcript_49840/m.128230 type:complete len:271 (+) Transcript_49840:1670-2482(+)
MWCSLLLVLSSVRCSSTLEVDFGLGPFGGASASSSWLLRLEVSKAAVAQSCHAAAGTSEEVVDEGLLLISFSATGISNFSASTTSVGVMSCFFDISASSTCSDEPDDFSLSCTTTFLSTTSCIMRGLFSMCATRSCFDLFFFMPTAKPATITIAPSTPPPPAIHSQGSLEFVTGTMTSPPPPVELPRRDSSTSMGTSHTFSPSAMDEVTLMLTPSVTLSFSPALVMASQSNFSGGGGGFSTTISLISTPTAVLTSPVEIFSFSTVSILLR